MMPQVEASERDFRFETDEQLSKGRLLIGSKHSITMLDLDINTDFTMVTGNDCPLCRVKVYDEVVSETSVKGDNNGSMIYYQ